MDLGYKYPTGSPAEIKPSKKNEKHYPSLHLDGKAAKMFCSECAVGDEISGTFKATIRTISEREDSGGEEYSATLEINDLTPKSVPGKSDKEALGYDRSKTRMGQRASKMEAAPEEDLRDA